MVTVTWPTKQVLVIRKKYPDPDGKLRSLRRGKEISQAAHAALAFLCNQLYRLNWFNRILHQVFGIVLIKVNKPQMDWAQNSYAKICCQVETEEELMAIAKKAEEFGVICNVITDSGKTEFYGQPTVTCLAIGPDVSHLIDQITGDLELY